MPKSIIGNTPAPQHGKIAINANTANTQLKTDRIDRLESDIYDNLTLHRSHLAMLHKLVNTAINDLNKFPESPALCNEQAGITLGIAQYLLEEFEYLIDGEIEAKEGKA